MKWKRTDAEVKAIVIESLINWKLGSDIARENGIHESTVSRIKDSDLQGVASESSAIAKLIDTNNKLQSLADKRLNEMLSNGEEMIRITELVQVRESTFKQNQLLSGKATENQNITIEWQV